MHANASIKPFCSKFGQHLFVILLLIISTILLLGGLGLLAANTSWTSTTEWRGKSKVDVLLGIKTNNERWDVDDLLSNTDVSLTDENTGVVDGLSETKLVDAGLKTTLQEILNLQGQDVIQLHAGLIEDTDTNKTTDQGVTFEESLGVLLVKGEQLTADILVFSIHQAHCRCIPGSTTNLGEGELDSPDLTLVAETIFSNELQLGVPGMGISDMNRDKLLYSGQLTDEQTRKLE